MKWQLLNEALRMTESLKSDSEKSTPAAMKSCNVVSIKFARRRSGRGGIVPDSGADYVITEEILRLQMSEIDLRLGSVKLS